MKKKALVSGITGQDGSYIAELLLSKGYEVFGIKRRTSTNNLIRIKNIIDKIHLIDGDLLDSGSLNRAVRDAAPDEVYNLAAQSFVRTSFDQPELTGEITGLGVTRLLEAVRTFAIDAKFYQASSSEMFGKMVPPHNEKTMFYPRSPYGAAKVYGYWMTVNYREAYNMFACNGILYNHETLRRGSEFVTQKIAQGVAAIKLNIKDKIHLGNIDAKRDWGHAKDYVRAMWMILNHHCPDDYVVATGESHSVKEFVEIAFNRVGLKWEQYVEIDPIHFRPTEVDFLQGDSSKIRNVLGWKPEISFVDLVNEMVDHALDHPEEWGDQQHE